jgi:elongation factor G
MQTPNPADIRNFAIVGHASSGKTMLSEAMLACAGVISRLGSTAEGTTVSDYHDSERARHISVQTTLLHANWGGKKFNLMDTPGYLDFMTEALAALRVADGTLVVVHAQNGAGVGTERVWNCASEFGIPKIIVVNACDKPNTNFDAMLQSIRDHFGAGVFPFELPVNPGPGFSRTLDVLRSEIVTYKPGDPKGGYREEPATGEWQARGQQLHRELIEHIAESDDTLLNKFFDQGGLGEEEFRAGIHSAVQRQQVIPLFCVSAETNVGVARLMDFIAKYGSSPADRPNHAARDGNDGPAEVQIKNSEPVAHVFKTMAEAHFGEMSFFRVYSGKVASGSELFNSNRKVNERIGQIYVLNGRERTSVPELGCGDIGAVVKLRDTHTGNTLCSGARPVRMEPVKYPAPTIHASLQINVKGEEDRVAAGLAALHEEDPAFSHRVDGELHQTIISAQGEMHLDVIVDRLKRRFNAHVELAEPRVPFRETIQMNADSRYRHKKQTGGAGQFAEVWMRLEPLARDAGVEFKQSLSGQNVDRVFVPSVEEGVARACKEGILAGYKVVDVKIDFYDGKMHPVDSKDIAFQIAGYYAFREAFLKARPCLLEPIHDVQIRIPEDCLGKVMGDVSSRRGKIVGVDVDGPFQVVRAQIPARELYRYSSQIRSLTGGRGLHEESFSHYEQVNRDLEAKIVEEYNKRRGAGQQAG